METFTYSTDVFISATREAAFRLSEVLLDGILHLGVLDFGFDTTQMLT